ncbi:hypothetical protein [Nocardiopsis halophila]|uniref:hypothetical protein n=1 Tax=Nocardiopsis halophila TaxID=141692 RepID=UPI000348A877|nr:hypothetical protein [Nocardiopsis halophila]
MRSGPGKPAVFVLGLAVVVAVVSVVARLGGGAVVVPVAHGLSRLEQEPVDTYHFVPDPEGWQRHEAVGISYAVPGDWAPVEESDLKDGYAASWHSPGGRGTTGELSVIDYPDAETDAYRALVEASSLQRSEELDLPLAGNDDCWEYDSADFYLAGSCSFAAAYLDPESGRRIDGMTASYLAVQVERDSAPVLVRVLVVEDTDSTATDLMDAVRPEYGGLLP